METKGFVSQFGNLTGIRLSKQKKRIEVLPYLAGKNFLEDGLVVIHTGKKITSLVI